MPKPKQSEQIFACENVIGIYDIADKKFYEGICVAMSAVWCRNMLQGTRDLLSCPAYDLASPLQAKYEIIFKNDYTKLLNSMGMKIGEEQTKPGDEALQHLVANSGQYMLRYPGHAMAALTSAGHFYYFFDPEIGLFKYDTSAGFKRKIKEEYPDEVRDDDWTLRKVVLE